MITEKQVRKLVEEHLGEGEYFLVETTIRSGNRIEVFIDGDHRVNIEVCRHLSHFLEEQLDRETEDFELTVSSAGADRPLKLPRQYSKNIGNELELITKTGDLLTATLLKVTDDGIEIERKPLKKSAKAPAPVIMTLTFDDIKSAKEVISFKK